MLTSPRVRAGKALLEQVDDQDDGDPDRRGNRDPSVDVSLPASVSAAPVMTLEKT
jgi:hypothetical protein